MTLFAPHRLLRPEARTIFELFHAALVAAPDRFACAGLFFAIAGRIARPKQMLAKK